MKSYFIHVDYDLSILHNITWTWFSFWLLCLLNPGCGFALSSMKPVPSVLLLAAVLFSTHIPPSICRPQDLSLFDRHDYKNQLNEVLLRARKDKVLPFFSGGNNRGHALRNASRFPTFHSLNSLEELVGLTKRNGDPPISIDLTFHLLRNMIEMARIENQREQAELNRKYLDEVGK